MSCMRPSIVKRVGYYSSIVLMCGWLDIIDVWLLVRVGLVVMIIGY